MNTITKSKVKKIDSFDWGWLVISFGMALGAGVVMVPVTIGLYGLLTFIICAIFAYPAIFLFQRLYINSLFGSKEPKCYSENISTQLGPKFGVVLSVIYFIMMAIWTIIYAELSCSMIYGYLAPVISAHHLTDVFSLNKISLLIIVILVIIGCKSQKLLFKISSIISILLLVCLIIAGAWVLPKWDINNAYHSISSASSGVSSASNGTHGFFNGLMVMFPFALTTILFLQSLSPMVMSYREKYSDVEFARKKCNFIMTTAFIILAIIILFYIIAFSGTISLADATYAKAHNESVFTLLSHSHLSPVFQFVGIIINFCAVLAAFLSIISGMRESLRGILLNVKKAVIRKDDVKTSGLLELIIAILIVLITWLPIVTHWSVYILVPLCGPIFGIVGCLVPALLVFKTPSLQKYRSNSIYYIIFIGIVLCISPLFS